MFFGIGDQRKDRNKRCNPRDKARIEMKFINAAYLVHSKFWQSKAL